MVADAPMPAADRIRFLESNLARQLHLVAAADAKTGFILALATAMLGVLAALSPSAPNWTVAPALWSMGASVALLTSLGTLAIMAFPRTRGPQGSSIYLQGIVAMSSDQYHALAGQLSEDRYIEDLARQCHRVAEIAKSKYLWLRVSMIALFLSVLPWTIAVFLLYQERN